MTMISPLRYPGSKRKLGEYLSAFLDANSIIPDLFVEPFAGGASASLYLLEKDKVKAIALSDKDPLIASFWRTVFFDSEWLISQIETVEVTLDKWIQLKKSKPRSIRERAFKCLFLNRTSFSGILSTGAGPIGGKQQKSVYPIDCRFPKEKLINRIRLLTKKKDKVFWVKQASWEEALRDPDIKERYKPEQVFYYLDPPFYMKSERLYNFIFKEDDHKALAKAIANVDSPWLVSYDANPNVESLYKQNGQTQSKVETLYSLSGTSGQAKSKELIISNLALMPSKTRLWKSEKK